MLDPDAAKAESKGPDIMIGIIGIAVLVGLCAGGIVLYSGSSILMALGAYMLFGWVVILTAIALICFGRLLKMRIRKDSHAYSG